MKNKPFPNLDGREEKTRQLRKMAVDLIGTESEYDNSSYMTRSLSCRAATLAWLMENENLSLSELAQTNNAYIGVIKKLTENDESAKRAIPRLDKEEVLEAVTEGARKAIWDVATYATDMPCSDFYASIKGGVEDAISEMRGNVF